MNNKGGDDGLSKLVRDTFIRVHVLKPDSAYLLINGKLYVHLCFSPEKRGK